MKQSLRFGTIANKPRLSLVTIRDGVKHYEDNLTEIFKVLLFVDPNDNTRPIWNEAIPYIQTHFEQMEDRSFSMTVSGKWRGKLVNVDMKLVEGMPKLVQLNIDGKDVMTNLDKHPLVNHVPEERRESKKSVNVNDTASFVKPVSGD